MLRGFDVKYRILYIFFSRFVDNSEVRNRERLGESFKSR